MNAFSITVQSKTFLHMYAGDHYDASDSITRPLSEGAEGLEFDVFCGVAWATVDVTGMSSAEIITEKLNLKLNIMRRQKK